MEYGLYIGSKLINCLFDLIRVQGVNIDFLVKIPTHIDTSSEGSEIEFLSLSWK